MTMICQPVIVFETVIGGEPVVGSATLDEVLDLIEWAERLNTPLTEEEIYRLLA